MHVVYHSIVAGAEPLAAPDDATLVAASFARLAPAVDAFVARFYARLFERRTDVRALFPAELREQRAKLAGMIQLVVDNLRRPDRLLPILEDLGLRHAAYGIQAADFDVAWAHAQRGCDAVFGVRRERQDAAIRRHLTRVIRASIRVLFGVPLYDANVPYKLVGRSIWETARPCIPPGTLAPSLFLAVFAAKKRFDIVEMDVRHLDRATGEVSIRRWKLFKFCARAFPQMLAFRRRMRHV